jgi:hypothetical protein
MTLRPFQRLNYADVPAKPRIPHGYDGAEARDVHVSSRVMGNVRVHVRSLGSGPPLLLVHGLMTSSYSFRYVLEPLAKHFRVFVVDMPGSGRSDKPLSPYFSAHHFGVFWENYNPRSGFADVRSWAIHWAVLYRCIWRCTIRTLFRGWSSIMRRGFRMLGM